ncbi:MAG: UDP-N-acetylglucosamine 2-epimerase (non-hydrolyzing) [Actinobacteria bacterium]|nr:MAG: UDP-N-acetylglucosamine 2-epimerase (non-hydrolyzing) [Actinomycetota bacterium]
MFIIGTRPEAVKVAPLVSAFGEAHEFEPLVVITGQHREMLQQVLTVFGIRPHVDLDVFSGGQSLTDVTTRVLEGLRPVMRSAAPGLVVVQGDTTSAFAGALAAFYQRLPIAHLEAGLRTFDRRNPYPEEANRTLIADLADVDLCPTVTARDNLLREGVDSKDIFVTGNTVIDALLWAAEMPPPDTPLLRRLDADRDKRMILVTAHRRESWGAGMVRIGQALRRVAAEHPDVLLVFPTHRNPRIREVIWPLLSELENVVLSEPSPYGEFVHLLKRAAIVLTDSGGIQEEAPSFGTPVLVLRETTERPEAVEAGTVRLVGTATDVIVEAVNRLLEDPVAYSRMARAVNPYGDGRAAQRCLAAVRHRYHGGPAVAEFRPPPPVVQAVAG